MVGEWIGGCVSVLAAEATEYQMPEEIDVRATVMHASGALVIAGEGSRYFRIPNARAIWLQLNDIFGSAESISELLGQQTP